MKRTILPLLLLMGCIEYNTITATDDENSNAELVEAIHCLKDTIVNLTKAVEDLRNEVQDKKDEGGDHASMMESTTSTLVSCPTQTQQSCPPPNPQSLCNCGGCCGWRRVTYHNMSDIRYTCPAGWHTLPPPTRGCGRASHAGLTCDSTFFPVSGSYSQICGVVQGYQVGYTDAFRASNVNRSITINDAYVTGVSITQGNPRKHVWTYAVGRYEHFSTSFAQNFCPCDHINNNLFVPEFVGARYYCESGNNIPNSRVDTGSMVYSSDVLWDGKGCQYPNTCCEFNSTLCFSREFSDAPLSGPLEMRICNYGTSQHSNVIISHLELYVK